LPTPASSLDQHDQEQVCSYASCSSSRHHSLAPGNQGVTDVAGVRDRAGEPVELGEHQGIASAHGREGLVQAGPGAVSAGESLVKVDPVRRDAEAGEDLGLGGEVWQDG